MKEGHLFEASGEAGSRCLAWVHTGFGGSTCEDPKKIEEGEGNEHDYVWMDI